MKERIGYIDSLKGLAILLMVMGHVISCQFPSWNVAERESPYITLLVWRLIYSFHMPLLMFCSGLVALHIKEYTWKTVGNMLWKRACTLLLPFFTVGAIRYWTVGGKFLDYWYLWILFQFIIVVIAIDGLCSKLPKNGRVVSSCVIIISAVLVHIVWKYFMNYEEMPFIDVWHWNLFPYFCMGVICARYDLCTKWFSREWVYTIALLVFGGLTYWITIVGNRIPKISLTGCLVPISAIVMLVYFFKNGKNETSVVEKWLQNHGRNSLEIYVIHFFFLFKMHRVGTFVIEQANTGSGTTIFFVQTMTSLIASIVIILFCYVVMSSIHKSSLLSVILLGRGKIQLPNTETKIS